MPWVTGLESYTRVGSRGGAGATEHYRGTIGRGRVSAEHDGMGLSELHRPGDYGRLR